MTTDDEKGKVIKQNPKHRKCPSCGHEEDIFASAAIPMGKGKYQLIWGSDADFCTHCEEPWGRNAEPVEHPTPYTPEDVVSAVNRYPGIPVPLALAKYMVDQKLFGSGIAELRPGMGWGGIHLETVGALVQNLTEAMYHQTKKEITVLIRCEDFPESYDHLWVEIKSVDNGTYEESDRFPFTGWPCCACGNPIPTGDDKASVMMLEKIATWAYPVWGNIIEGTSGRAAAVLCGKCIEAGNQPDHAIKKDGGSFELVPLSELEDIDAPNKD